jgi:hypothetical protein
MRCASDACRNYAIRRSQTCCLLASRRVGPRSSALARGPARRLDLPRLAAMAGSGRRIRSLVAALAKLGPAPCGRGWAARGTRSAAMSANLGLPSANRGGWARADQPVGLVGIGARGRWLGALPERDVLLSLRRHAEFGAVIRAARSRPRRRSRPCGTPGSMPVGGSSSPLDCSATTAGVAATGDGGDAGELNALSVGTLIVIGSTRRPCVDAPTAGRPRFRAH